MVINLQDVRDRQTVYPLVADLISAAQTQGFILKTRWAYPLGFLGKIRPDEPVLVFCKP
jgi:hypothetical protein